MTRYQTIVADPPWAHDEPNARWVKRDGGAQLPYPSMSLDQIAAVPVSNVSTAGAHLYLWTTGRFLFDAPSIAHAWGFDVSSVLVWCKPPRGFGLGGKFHNNIEFVLFCRDFAGVGRITAYLADAADRKGVTRRDVDRAMGTSDMAGWWLSRLPHRSKCPLPEQYERLKEITGAGGEMDAEVAGWNEYKGEAPRADSRWFQWQRGAHSVKPEAFMDMVESVSPEPRLEMFSRRARLGWDTWGAESLHGGVAA